MPLTPEQYARRDIDASLAAAGWLVQRRELALRTTRTHTYLRTRAQGISGSMPKIDQDTIRRAAIPLPPFLEQEAIVEAVEDQLSAIDHLEADLDAKLKSAQALRQSILRRAFAGELVTQDPNDEPASVLLERIAAERAGIALASVGRGHRSSGSKSRAASVRRKPRRRAVPQATEQN